MPDYKKIILSGTVYGRLTVIGLIPNKKTKSREYLYDCICECGAKVVVRGASLRAGYTSSCGCLLKERRKESKNAKPVGVAARNMLLARYKKQSQFRKIEWDLSDDEAFDLFCGDCVYCGDPPSSVAKATASNFMYNGIDRVDSKLGYSFENCVSCCKHCNFAKSDFEVDDFLMHIKKIYRYSVKL